MVERQGCVPVKRALSIVLMASCLGAAELLLVSYEVDLKNLEKLFKHYKKEIIISDSRAYLVPSECLLERHFGGLSNGDLTLVGEELHNGYLSMTQEVFEAKDVSSIQKEIQKQKISDTIEAKGAKAFLEESDGHLFGGLSQGEVNLQEQKKLLAASQENGQKREQKVTHPSCKLLGDGSGFLLINAKDTKLYNQNGLQPLSERSLFR